MNCTIKSVMNYSFETLCYNISYSAEANISLQLLCNEQQHSAQSKLILNY